MMGFSDYCASLGDDPIGAHLRRICSTLFACGQCGKTIIGANLRYVVNFPIDLTFDIPRFACQCSGILEPLASANAKPNEDEKHAG
jgi:hypothetical protein